MAFTKRAASLGQLVEQGLRGLMTADDFELFVHHSLAFGRDGRDPRPKKVDRNLAGRYHQIEFGIRILPLDPSGTL